MTTTKENRAPGRTLRVGHVESAIWTEEKEADGRTFLQHSIRVQKRYRDKDGEWKSTDYYYPDELPKLILAAFKAYESVVLKESGNGDEKSD